MNLKIFTVLKYPLSTSPDILCTPFPYIKHPLPPLYTTSLFFHQFYKTVSLPSSLYLPFLWFRIREIEIPYNKVILLYVEKLGHIYPKLFVILKYEFIILKYEFIILKYEIKVIQHNFVWLHIICLSKTCVGNSYT